MRQPEDGMLKRHTYTRLVEPATDTYALGLAHGMRLLPLSLLEGAFPLGHFELLLPLNKRRRHFGCLLLGQGPRVGYRL